MLNRHIFDRAAANRCDPDDLMHLAEGLDPKRRHSTTRQKRRNGEPYEDRWTVPVETEESDIRQQQEGEIHVEQNRRRQDDPIRQPEPSAVTACGVNEQDGQPHGGHHRQRIWPSLDARPRRPGQYPADNTGAQCDSARRELLAQHHYSGRRGSDSETAWCARPELCGRKDLKPGMHEQVVQPVDGVDIAQHLPQLLQRSTVRGRNGRGLVVPERRAARAAQTHRGGQHSNDQRVQRSRRSSHQYSPPNTPLWCQKR